MRRRETLHMRKGNARSKPIPDSCERGMIGDVLGIPHLTKPAIRQIELHLFTQTAIRRDPTQIANELPAKKEHGIHGRASIVLTVEVLG